MNCDSWKQQSVLCWLIMKGAWLDFPKELLKKGKGLNELLAVEFIKQFPLRGREWSS